MTIECIGNISVVDKTPKEITYKRKGYFIFNKWIKPKKLKRVKYVPLKEPYLFGTLTIVVDADYVLGGTYMDENINYWCCTSKTNLGVQKSSLKNVSTNLGRTFNIPTRLTLVMQQAPEK